MTHPQQTTREVIEQLVEALEHCMGAITERGLNGSPDQAEKWGLQLPLARAEYAITAGKQAVEQTQGEAVDIDALCARIKAADDACADMDYMLDSNDCISVLRGTWRGPLLNDMPPHPQATEPAPRPFLEINYPQAGEHKHEYHYFGTTQSHRRCRHCNEPEPAPSTAGERDRTIVSLPIPASASDLKSDSAKELEEVIADLLMYAGDNGYGHIDYADTMRHAAALLSAPALPVPSDSDDLIKALADVRDLFPIPERGSKLEHAWMEAVAFPESVPAYVRACIAPAALPVGELTDQSNLATIAGLEASTGHLSAMVDELRALLGRALDNFTTLHNAAKPDEDGPDIDAIIPGGVFARFVDEDAAIRYALNQTCHAEAVAADSSQPVREPASPSTAGERDNKTEMLAKLTAWLDSLGGKLHTYSLRGIALAGFEEGWSAALMQSTADHIAQNRKLVAALPVGELTHPTADMQIAGGAVELDYTGVQAAPNTVGWLTAARVWLAMERASTQPKLLTFEALNAVREAHQNKRTNDYFEARPQIDNTDRRRVFENGYKRGFDDGMVFQRDQGAA